MKPGIAGLRTFPQRPVRSGQQCSVKSRILKIQPGIIRPIVRPEFDPMPTYVAMLRGINLGPHKRVKMEALRKSFESIGLKNVQTYIQSGNVVFQAGKTSIAALRKKIEEQITSDFGFSSLTILRSQDEFGKVIKMNPFLKQ